MQAGEAEYATHILRSGKEGWARANVMGCRRAPACQQAVAARCMNDSPGVQFPAVEGRPDVAPEMLEEGGQALAVGPSMRRMGRSVQVGWAAAAQRRVPPSRASSARGTRTYGDTAYPP